MNNTSMDFNKSINANGIESDERLTKYQYSLFLINVIICGINLVGNSVVLVLICQRRLLGRTTNVFVFSLAMADVLCSIGSIPYNVVQALEIPMSVYLCKSYFYAICVSRTAVSYTIVLLTTEKILNILHPARFITAGRCMFFISLVWFFSTAYNVWTVVFYTIYDTNTISKTELLLDSTKGMYGISCFFSHRFEFLQSTFLAIDLTVLFLIPCLILFLQFCVIVRKQHGTIKQRFETYWYIMRFLFFIFIVFFGCHMPFEIATIVKNSHRPPSSAVSSFYTTSTTFYFTRGFFNLIVYIYFKQYVCRRKRRLSTAGHNKTQFEMRERRQCRGLSVNEYRIHK